MTPERGDIRPARAVDIPSIAAVVNDAAVAYRGVIPADCWHDPYMPLSELRQEIDAGVAFSVLEQDDRIVAVMGLQQVGDVALIRHAYVLASHQRQGLGGALLEHIRRHSALPMLVGTWRAASWAVRFYETHGFRCLDTAETARLLRRYWTVSPRQMEVSVVLADDRWPESQDG
ncbi:MAG: GNAT family N-acetyltransferase [Deinococcales bacterium]